MRKMALKLARDHVFRKFLLDGSLIILHDLDDAVNGTIDIFLKDVIDNHRGLLCNIERAVIVTII